MVARLLFTEEVKIMAALAHGATLKVHRTVDGEKSYALHFLHGDDRASVNAAAVESLIRKRLLVSNMKFPAATFLFTKQGISVVENMGIAEDAPLVSRMDE